MPLVAGVDSSTQSCKVVVRDAETGELRPRRVARRTPTAPRSPRPPGGPRCDAAPQAGGLDGVAAVSVGGQQHGMVCLDDDGEVVRAALLWNDTRSAGAAADLIARARRPRRHGPTRSAWCRWPASPSPSCAGSPRRAGRTPPARRRCCLPHDWLTWRLAGAPGLDALRTDRGDACGTGYWSPAAGEYRPGPAAARRSAATSALPRVLGPAGSAGRPRAGALLGPGAGDNAARGARVSAAEPGDVVVSIGTSGVVSAVVRRCRPPTRAASWPGSPTRPAGSCRWCARSTPRGCWTRPPTCSAWTSRSCRRWRCPRPPGADGLVLLPYLEGERTPNRPTRTGAAARPDPARTRPRAHLARAAVEGMLCALADGLDALVAPGRRRSTGCC